MKWFIFLTGFACFSMVTKAQTGKLRYTLTDTVHLKAVNVGMQPALFKGKKAVKVYDILPASETELRIARLSDTAFHNGTIELELAGEPMKNSGEGARGFVGIAFRVNAANEKFECIYLRPTNGRADDQVRRNHSVQYISFPEFPWYKLRKEFPEKYESYVDLEAGTWTKVKIEVQGNTAKLFVHGATQPTLIVSDLKHGDGLRGGIGLWVGPGTEAHFRNLVVVKKD
jgi:hypothetical protein